MIHADLDDGEAVRLAQAEERQWQADRVVATEGNLNNAIGLPLTLLRLSDRDRAAVIELGMNHRGETRELAAIARPTVVVVNNAQREHQEFMASVAEVAAEHADAVARAAAAAAWRCSTPTMRAFRSGATRRAAPARAWATFGLDAGADVAGAGHRAFRRQPPRARRAARAVRDDARGPRRAQVRNALAAAAAALAAGAPLDAVGAGSRLSRRRRPARRAPRARRARVVLDDTYNANPGFDARRDRRARGRARRRASW